MATILRFKLGVIIISITVLILIPLLRTNFNAPVSIKRWQQLTWDDFQGFVKPFTGWEAAISSTVYLEFDSMTMSYAAYAGQNNQLSWTKDTSKYGLNHEQYHFNITELHARKMNTYIKNNPNLELREYQLKLDLLRGELSRMQSKYDRESDHSLNFDRQRRWEYKIDSLLLEYDKESGMVVDNYSGASAFFPVPPTFTQGIENLATYRRYKLQRYNMLLMMTSYQYQEIDTAYFFESIRVLYHAVSIISFDADTARHQVDVVFEDSVNNSFGYHKWINNKNFIYRLTAVYPNREETTGFEEIANSFINSFKGTNETYRPSNDEVEE